MNPLDQFMSESGMTDTALAARLGVTQPYVWRLRRSTRRPSLGVALKLAEITGKPASDFAWETIPEKAA